MRGLPTTFEAEGCGVTDVQVTAAGRVSGTHRIEAEHDLLTATRGELDPAALAAIHRRFGLEIVGPPPQW